MRKFTSALLAVAAGVMVQGFAAGSASALPLGKAHAPATSATQVHMRGGHGFHHRRFGGSGIYFYSGPRYYYGGYGRCHWLKERAEDTGRRYWWRRYWACRNGF